MHLGVTSKAAANHLSPKVQLVLSTELQTAIKNRVDENKPVTSKKAKGGKPRSKHAPVLMAADIAIPEGIFRAGSETPLKQIEAAQVGPDAQGILVLDPFEAVPYLRRHRKVSCKGLALAVIGAQDDLLLGVGEAVRTCAIVSTHCPVGFD